MASTIRVGRHRSPVLVAVAVGAVALGGCGGGADDPAATAPRGTAATTPTAGGTATTRRGAAPTPSFTALANAVCRVEVAEVPPVPDPGATVAEGRRYVAAIGRAARGLSSALRQLERQRPESQKTLDPLVDRARTVERTARAAATKDGERAADVQDDVRIAIARLNETSSAARLPGCAL